MRGTSLRRGWPSAADRLQPPVARLGAAVASRVATPEQPVRRRPLAGDDAFAPLPRPTAPRRRRRAFSRRGDNARALCAAPRRRAGLAAACAPAAALKMASSARRSGTPASNSPLHHVRVCDVACFTRDERVPRARAARPSTRGAQPDEHSAIAWSPCSFRELRAPSARSTVRERARERAVCAAHGGASGVRSRPARRVCVDPADVELVWKMRVRHPGARVRRGGSPFARPRAADSPASVVVRIRAVSVRIARGRRMLLQTQVLSTRSRLRGSLAAR